MAKFRIVIYFLILVIFSAVTTIIIMPEAQGELSPYFDGEAVNYNSKILFGTTNTGRFELFGLENNAIAIINVIYSDDKRNDRFLDLIFSEEGSGLFVYLVNGTYLYKYDISDLLKITLVEKAKDNSGDYFYGLGRAGSNIFTVGEKGLKVWNNSLQVIDSYKNFNFKYPKSISFSGNGNYIFNTNQSRLEVIDSFYRNRIFKIDLAAGGEHSMRTYTDDKAGIVYIADNHSLKKVKIDGSYTEFNHISKIGYDVDGISGSDYIYFSDGIGIVKNKKSDLKPIDWVYTTSLGGGNGWSMGLRVVENFNQEYVIVFNGSSILVFDENLNLLDFYKAPERRRFVPAPLALGLDRNRAASNSLVSLHGTGFGLNEELKIKFGNDFFYARSDQSGQFQTIVTVPQIKAQNTEIRVNGQTSGLSYSINFFVE